MASEGDVRCLRASLSPSRLVSPSPRLAGPIWTEVIAMITLLGSRRRLCDGLTRRETLKAGALSLLGGAFNLPSLLAIEESKRVRPGKAKNVIRSDGCAMD